MTVSRARCLCALCAPGAVFVSRVEAPTIYQPTTKCTQLSRTLGAGVLTGPGGRWVPGGQVGTAV